MIRSDAYNYINVLKEAADGSWLRGEVINNNLSNVDTPGYKRKDVDFEGALEHALKFSKYETLDDKVSSLSMRHLEVTPYTDSAAFSYRIDKNNVDVDVENVELASNQIKYNALIDSMSQEYKRLKSVLT